MLQTHLDERRTFEALRTVLADAGYTAHVVTKPQRLRPFLPASEPIPLGVADERLDTLLRLFALRQPVGCAEAAAGLAPLDIAELEATGLVTVAGDKVTAPDRLLAHDGLLLVGDSRGPADRDLVSPFTGPSTALARLTPRDPCRTMLDLGTGSGIEALLGARHCERVTAVDVNPRALRVAALNARVNGVENVRLLEGSWFEPVGDERFDLIVANPPYVVSPDDEFTYRDSGRPAGALVEELCRAMPSHLEEGGIAIMLCSWPHSSPDDWSGAPIAWVRDTGCDALILGQGTVEPLEHATSWNVPPVQFMEPDTLRDTVARWVRYYRVQGIGAISFGAIVLRRATERATWVHVTRASKAPGDRASGHLAALLEGQDLLCELEDAALLSQVFAVPEGIKVGQRFERRAERFVARSALVELDGGLGIQSAIDPDALDVLFACDGERSLSDCVDRAAGRSGERPEALTPIAIGAVRELLADGLLRLA